MKNSVVLYKTSWNFSSPYQPYFLSDASRENYFNSLDQIEVPYKGSVNIHFDYNLELSIIVPLDISIVSNYNFAKIIYNDKIYFSNILDYKQISFNNSELQLKRNISVERTNYFQYFNDFQIKRISYSNIFSYKKDSIWYKPKFRFSKKVFVANEKMSYYDKKLEANIEYPVVYKDFLVLFSSADPNSLTQSVLYGTPVQYQLYLMPLDILNNSVKIYFKTIDYTTDPYDVTDEVFNIDKVTPKVFIDALNSISPNMVSFKHIKLPVGLKDDGIFIPFYCQRGISSDLYYLIATSTSYDYQNITNFKIYFDYEFFNPFGEIELRFYGGDSSIIIDKSDFTGISKKIRVERYLFLNPLEDENVCFVKSLNVDSVYEYNSNIFAFSFDYGDSSTFLLNAEADFNAQNRYYDAMTRSVRNQKIIDSAISSVGNFSLGASQIAFGTKMGSVGGQVASTSLGVGNVIRGVTDIASGVNDVYHYLEQRELYAANEKSKPSQMKGSGTAESRLFESLLECKIIEDVPFEDDYNSWVNNSKKYGVEVNLFREKIDINEFKVNNELFIAANAVCNSYLNAVEYSELYSLLSNGCRYFII